MNLTPAVVAACCGMLTDRVGSTVDYTDGDVVWRAERLADGFQFRLVGTPNAERVNAQPWIDSPLPFDA